MDRKEIAAILASAGLRPQHQFGQNFMVDQNILRAIVDAGEVGQQDIVLEVGPGVGNLTRLLALRARHVLAVDIDYKLLPAARCHHAALTNITWLNADVLAGKHAIEPLVLNALHELLAAYPNSPLKLVSNLPYNAASPLVAELLVAMWSEHASANAPAQFSALSVPPLTFSRMAFTVQWEVGQRMVASPGTRDYGSLGILMQAMADAEIVRKIPPGAFWPPPKVQSALAVVIPLPARMRVVRDAMAFQRFLAEIFSHRRQTLGNGLKHFFGNAWDAKCKSAFTAEGFDLLLRPDMFKVEDLLRCEMLAHLLQTQLST